MKECLHVPRGAVCSAPAGLQRYGELLPPHRHGRARDVLRHVRSAGRFSAGSHSDIFNSDLAHKFAFDQGIGTLETCLFLMPLFEIERPAERFCRCPVFRVLFEASPQKSGQNEEGNINHGHTFVLQY